MYLAENKWGLALLDFIKVSEEDMIDKQEYKPITGSLIYVCSRQIIINY